MRKPVTLITGANGELGRDLMRALAHAGHHILTIDLAPIPEDMKGFCSASIVGDILDQNLMKRLIGEFEIHEIYHLAALLSTRSEYTPDQAHHVNVDGTLNLLQLAHDQSQWHGHTIKFLFPSSIAIYGIPNRALKDQAAAVGEDDFNFPITMYGCNKLYCEQLGRYFTLYYKQLSAEPKSSGVDFRSIRFPGLISALTTPSGGTSDYAPEIIHAAAKGQKDYACFVDAQTRLPFMAMPDATRALMDLAKAPAEKLSQRIYNVTSFSVTAGEILQFAQKGFPDFKMTFQVDAPRARIVDSWPGNVDDRKARQDWGWQPKYDVQAAFFDYLIPTIREFYRKAS